MDHMAPDDSSELDVTQPRPSTPPLARLRAGALFVWRWFRDFRRTRPFWGALWLGLGGYAVTHFSASSLGFAVSGGWSSLAGYILGGGMILFALVGWFAPHYSSLVGFVGFLLALVSFLAANLGGFLIGSVLGVLGGSMVWGWGEKKPRSRVRRGQPAPDATP